MILTPPVTDENGNALPQIVSAILVKNGEWESWTEDVDAQALLYEDGRVWIENKWQTQIVNVRYIEKFLEIKADGKQPDALTTLKTSHFGIRDKVEQSLMEQ